MHGAKQCCGDGLDHKVIGSRFVLKIISCPIWQESKPSMAGSDTGCSDADAELSHMQLFFPGALAWKERVERRVQRRQVCCKSTCGCNHVDLFLGHLCPPLCFCSIYRSNLSCTGSSSPDRSSFIIYNDMRAAEIHASLDQASQAYVTVWTIMEDMDTSYHYIKTPLMQWFNFFGGLLWTHSVGI